MNTVASSTVDSRAYAFVYPIRGAHDVPADFCLRAGLRELRSGVFLPQDQAGWFSKPRYPACVLLLVSADLVIATHPSSREREIRIPLQEVLTIESSKMLLDGRITFYTAHRHYTYRYNTRDARHVDDFLFHVRQALMKEPPIPMVGLWCFGGSLDLKFATAESRELDGREQLLLRFFSPPQHSIGRHWVFRREHWKPGQYVGVTTRRLLWISDGYDGGRDLYGTVSRYVPLSRRMDVTLTCHDKSCELGLTIGSDLRWAIPVPADLHGEAESFTRELRRLRLDVLSEASQ
jgi:hypothetical protein